MLLLALISTGLSAYQTFGGSRGFNPGGGQQQGGMPNQGDFPSNGDMTTPPSFEGTPSVDWPSEGTPAAGNIPSQGTPSDDNSGQTLPFGGEGNEGDGQRDGAGGNGFSGGRPGEGGNNFGVMRYLELGLNGLGLVLAIAAAVFLLKGKKWAGILALVWAGAMLVFSVYGLFNSQNLLTTIARVVCVLLAIAIFVLLLLKKNRMIWAGSSQTGQSDDDDDDDDDDEFVTPQFSANNQPARAESTSAQPFTGVKDHTQTNNAADNDDDDDDDD